MNNGKINVKQLTEYEKYKKIFLKETEKILNIPKMPKCTFLHIGATSFKKSFGRDVVDILVVVENLHAITSFDEKRLNNIKYHRVNHGERGVVRYNRFTNLLTLDYNVSLYVVQDKTKTHSDFLLFQNLLNDEKIFKKFLEEKELLAKKFENNIKEYNKRKNYIMKNIIKKELKND